MIERRHVGPRMSQSVTAGGLVFLAGQVATQPASSVAEQTRQIVARIDELLTEAGSHKRHLLSASIWLVDIGRIGEMNAVWDAWVEPGQTPARATVEARLAAPEYLVEIAAVAAVSPP